MSMRCSVQVCLLTLTRDIEDSPSLVGRGQSAFPWQLMKLSTVPGVCLHPHTIRMFSEVFLPFPKCSSALQCESTGVHVHSTCLLCGLTSHPQQLLWWTGVFMLSRIPLVLVFRYGWHFWAPVWEVIACSQIRKMLSSAFWTCFRDDSVPSVFLGPTDKYIMARALELICSLFTKHV